MMAHSFTGELATLFWTAIALGTDALSLGLGLGMQGLTHKQIRRVSATIGLFHILMPLLGMVAGLYLHEVLGDVAQRVGAVILIGLGLHMLFHAIRGNQDDVWELNQTAGLGLLIFAMSVSVDALSVGFSFGLSDAHLGIAVTLFGIIGGLMAAIGLILGSVANRMIGGYIEGIGGAILIAFGVNLWMSVAPLH